MARTKRKTWDRKKNVARIMGALQQLFLVATLGSLFLFVPLHSDAMEGKSTADLPSLSSRSSANVQGTAAEIVFKLDANASSRGQGDMDLALERSSHRD